MLVTVEDVRRRLSGDGGAALEQTVLDLLHWDAHHCDVDRKNIDWDDRTNVGDRGRDIFVRVGAKRPPARLLREQPTIWSIKSGANGTKPATLRRELEKADRAHLIAHLRQGGEFVWVALAASSIDQRDEFLEAINDLAAAHGFSPQQISVVYGDHIWQYVQEHVGLCFNLFPDVERAAGLSVRSWGQNAPLLDASVPWVDFDGRGALVESIRAHLVGDAGSSCLHIAGISGIGKTRLALQACSTEELLRTVRYFPSLERALEAIDRVRNNDAFRARFVIDEVTLESIDQVEAATRNLEARLRVITIGPARADSRSREGIIALPAPEDPQAIVEVLKGVGTPEFADEVLHEVAEISNHDLRFALLVLEAVRQDPELRRSATAAIRELREPIRLYRRVLASFKEHLAHTPEFDEHYQWLTLVADVGIEGELAEELGIVASLAPEDINEIRLQSVADQAAKCGLGNKPGRFFEAIPRGMATLIFSEFVWGAIRSRLNAVIVQLGAGRLGRSFQLRVQQCPSSIREEVARATGDHFRVALEHAGLAVIADSEYSRTMAEWVKLDPSPGLAWLRGAVERASLEELVKVPGSQGMFGRSGGRRELVWLCEHLGCFAEYFSECEAILFRLALAENEDIGNNATAVWREKYRIYLSNTEVPYPRRAEKLLDRFVTADDQTLRLVLKGIESALSLPRSVMAPPRVVGGRIVPDEWRPETFAEGRTMRVHLARQVLESLSELEAGLRARVVEFVAANVRLFLFAEVIGLLRQTLSPSSLHEEHRHDLIGELEEIEADALEEAQRENESAKQMAVDIRSWIDNLLPIELSERVRFIVSRAPWDFRLLGRKLDDEERAARIFEDLAEQILDSPAVLEELQDWLGSDQAKSAWTLGATLSRLDKNRLLAGRVESWLSAAKCQMFCLAYANQHRSETTELEPWAVRSLDAMLDEYPFEAATSSILIDPSRRGFDRVMKALSMPNVDRGRAVIQLFGDEWKNLLTNDDRARVIALLCPSRAEERNPEWSVSALQLITMWQHPDGDPLDPVVADAVLGIVTDPPVGVPGHWTHDWQDAAALCLPHYPTNVVDSALVQLTAPGLSQLRDEALEVLKVAAQSDPEALLQQLDPIFEDGQRRVMFFIDVFRGLLDSIPVGVLKAWIQEKGIDTARALARHLPSPEIKDDSVGPLPELTEWFLTEYGHDERAVREFILGRHSGQAYWGPSHFSDKQVQMLESALGDHKLAPIREWVRHEIESHRDDLERYRQREEERDRL